MKKLENKNKKDNKIGHTISNYSDEEEEVRLDAILGHVCGDVNKDTHEQYFDHVLSDLNDVPRKN